MPRTSSKDGGEHADSAAAAQQFERLVEVISRSQHSYRELIDNLDQAVFTISLEGEVRVANRRACEILGVSFQGLIGHKLGEFIEEPAATQVRQAIPQFLAKGSWSGRVPVRLKREQSTRQFDCWLQAITDDTGAGAAIGWARDVTEAKQIEQQLMRSERFAAIGQMMAGAAHELNNPLTAILGVSDLLRERATNDDMRRHAELICQQARRAAAIVQDLMALSRPPSSARTTVALDDLLRGLLKKAEPSLREKNIAATFESPANLPPIEGESKLLSQVFLNLIENAEQAIPAGGSGSISVQLSIESGKVCVAISDDGSGISADHLARIFDPFFTTKRPGGGSGLGLTICLAVVKDHGGLMSVDSAPGRGTTVRVFLPFAAGEGPVQVAALAARPERRAALSAAHSVLVIDDEEGIREIVQEVLSTRGVRVQSAGDAKQALARLASGPFDAVLCDFNLPGMRGPELCEKIRAKLGSPAPRFVLMTGEMLDPGAIADFSSRGISVLQKPFSMSALTSLLTELFAAKA